VNFPDRQIGVVDASAAAVDLVAVRFFSTGASYAVGDYVVQAGVLYRATAVSAPGAFTPANWSKLATFADAAAAPPLMDGVASAGVAVTWSRGDHVHPTDTTLVPLAGGTMTGPLVLNANPSAALGAATKQQVDLKADLASPTFTGDPKAPTPLTADNDTSIATTAYVKAQGYATVASPVFTGDPQAPTPATADSDTSIATTAFVKAQSYATLASPVFTGNPTAPTPAPGDNDTSIATTAFVVAQGYAPLANPVFTGNPVAPTQALSDADTSIATTAFVRTGVTDGSDAAAGQVGEFLTATAAGVAMTNSTARNITSLVLSAGDWDVWGSTYFGPSVGMTSMNAGLSLTTATLPATGLYMALNIPSAAMGGSMMAVPQQRFSSASSFTVFMVGVAAFASGTCAATAYIFARRRR
jgi:hypothetical protein